MGFGVYVRENSVELQGGAGPVYECVSSGADVIRSHSSTSENQLRRQGKAHAVIALSVLDFKGD